MRVLGINAVFHDPAAALDRGRPTVVAAAEEERFSRRKHGKRPVPFAAWEQPVAAARWCLRPGRPDARPTSTSIGFSYDPSLVRSAAEMELDDPWDHLRTRYATARTAVPGRRAARPGPGPGPLRAATTWPTLPRPAWPRGRAALRRAGLRRPRRADSYPRRPVPRRPARDPGHPAAAALARSALRGPDRPSGFPAFQRRVQGDGAGLVRPAALPGPAPGEGAGHAAGGFRTEPVDWAQFAPGSPARRGLARRARGPGRQRAAPPGGGPAGRWPAELHERTGDRVLAMAGGTALNCVANTVLCRTRALRGGVGAARGRRRRAPRWARRCSLAAEHGRAGLDDDVAPTSAAVRRRRDRGRAAPRPGALRTAAGRGRAPSPKCWPGTGSSPGSRAAASTGRAPSGTGRCSPIRDAASTSNGSTTSRAASSSGRSRRWCWPTARPRTSSPAARCPARTCCSCTTWRRPGRTASRPWCTWTARRGCRPWTRRTQPLTAALLTAFERRTGLPVLVNTSLNTAGRPMVDDLRDALECFGSTPVDALAIGPFVVRRRDPRPGAIPTRS